MATAWGKCSLSRAASRARPTGPTSAAAASGARPTRTTATAARTESTLMRLVFMGTPESAVPTLRRCVEEGHEVLCVWTQPDRPAGRGNKLKAPPVKEFALSKGLTVHQPSKIKTGEALALFTGREFDAAV